MKKSKDLSTKYYKKKYKQPAKNSSEKVSRS